MKSCNCSYIVKLTEPRKFFWSHTDFFSERIVLEGKISEPEKVFLAPINFGKLSPIVA